MNVPSPSELVRWWLVSYLLVGARGDFQAEQVALGESWRKKLVFIHHGTKTTSGLWANAESIWWCWDSLMAHRPRPPLAVIREVLDVLEDRTALVLIPDHGYHKVWKIKAPDLGKWAQDVGVATPREISRQLRRPSHKADVDVVVGTATPMTEEIRRAALRERLPLALRLGVGVEDVRKRKPSRRARTARHPQVPLPEGRDDRQRP